MKGRKDAITPVSYDVVIKHIERMKQERTGNSDKLLEQIAQRLAQYETSKEKANK